MFTSRQAPPVIDPARACAQLTASYAFGAWGPPGAVVRRRPHPPSWQANRLTLFDIVADAGSWSYDSSYNLAQKAHGASSRCGADCLSLPPTSEPRPRPGSISGAAPTGHRPPKPSFDSSAPGSQCEVPKFPNRNPARANFFPNIFLFATRLFHDRRVRLQAGEIVRRREVHAIDLFFAIRVAFIQWDVGRLVTVRRPWPGADKDRPED